MASLVLTEHSVSISIMIVTLGLLNAVDSLIQRVTPHLFWTINVQSDGPLRPLTVQTFLPLPNGRTHLVIFTSNSYNDERVGGVSWGGRGEGLSLCESSVCLLLSFCNYI